MNILTKLKATAAALLIVVGILGVVITIAHLVEGKVVRRSIVSFKLTEALFTRATVVRLLFVEGDTAQVERLKEVDENVATLIGAVQREFPSQHRTQTTLADLAEAHANVIDITNDVISAGAISVVSGERSDIVNEVSAISRGLVADISEVNAVNAIDLTRVVRLANLLLLIGLGVMVIIILSGTYIIYRSFARPLTEICASLERGDYGLHTQMGSSDHDHKSIDEVARIKAALKALSEKVDSIQRGRAS